jgi:predicted lipid-binding transport protein (Tim44 family)
MNSPLLQLLVLAGIAIFLILRLKSVLGTRDGFEGPPRSGAPNEPAKTDRRQEFEVIEGGPDHDIIDHVPEDSDAAAALAEMKRAEPSFTVAEFLSGARGAYEWILMGFERGNLDDVAPILAEDVYEAFAQVVDERQTQGLTVEAEFIGVRGTSLTDAQFDTGTNRAEITVKFVGELISVVRDANGEVVEGTPGQSKRQKDTWTFERVMGADDPNWRLVATGE